MFKLKLIWFFRGISPWLFRVKKKAKGAGLAQELAKNKGLATSGILKGFWVLLLFFGFTVVLGLFAEPAMTTLNVHQVSIETYNKIFAGILVLMFFAIFLLCFYRLKSLCGVIIDLGRDRDVAEIVEILKSTAPASAEEVLTSLHQYAIVRAWTGQVLAVTQKNC